jgi:hypothetical protein
MIIPSRDFTLIMSRKGNFPLWLNLILALSILLVLKVIIKLLYFRAIYYLWPIVKNLAIPISSIIP